MVEQDGEVASLTADLAARTCSVSSTEDGRQRTITDLADLADLADLVTDR